MRSVYTGSSLIEDMRRKLSKDFGITVSDNKVTVRWNRNDQLASVTMVIIDCDDGSPRCDICGTITDHLKDVKVEYRYEGDIITTQTIKACVDCYCPK